MRHGDSLKMDTVLGKYIDLSEKRVIENVVDQWISTITVTTVIIHHSQSIRAKVTAEVVCNKVKEKGLPAILKATDWLDENAQGKINQKNIKSILQPDTTILMISHSIPIYDFSNKKINYGEIIGKGIKISRP